MMKAKGRSLIYLVLACFSGSMCFAHEATWSAFENQLASQAQLGAGDLTGERTNRGDLAVCNLQLSLIDAETGESLPGLIRVTDKDGVISVGGLVNRGLGLKEEHASTQWYALPESSTISLPQKPLTIEAISGIDSELSKQDIDLSRKGESEVTLKLQRLHLLDQTSSYPGNTHLHLKNINRKQADEYLQVVTQADGVDLVFVSYLLRTSEDKTYISNEYRKKDLARLSTPATKFGFGEEHRNNFEAFGMGYGHVMLLDIDELVKPVSIGRGIMDTGPDYPNMKKGIEQAHQQDATVIWCHNDMGHEDIPNWVTEHIHAQNIFDGGNTGTYKDTFYRYLNTGLRVPFSTGTDWFMFDFSRVYAQLDKPFSEDNWLEALRAGKTFITNGPLLELKVGDESPGGTINLAQGETRIVNAKAQGRNNFGSIEVVVNGSVVRASRSRKVNGHYEAELVFPLHVEKPSWVALRIPETNQQNELGGELFAHTSPVYLNVDGKGTFLKSAAESLIAEMKESITAIGEQALFDSSGQRSEVLDYYHQAIQSLEDKINSNYTH
jgi:hypothetical protein